MGGDFFEAQSVESPRDRNYYRWKILRLLQQGQPKKLVIKENRLRKWHILRSIIWNYIHSKNLFSLRKQKMGDDWVHAMNSFKKIRVREAISKKKNSFLLSVPYKFFY